MTNEQLTKYSIRHIDWPNGNRSWVFDVESPAIWCTKDDGTLLVQCWQLSRLIVKSNKSFEVMRFMRKDEERGWTKAFNPYAGIKLSAEQLEFLRGIL